MAAASRKDIAISEGPYTSADISSGEPQMRFEELGALKEHLMKMKTKAWSA